MRKFIFVLLANVLVLTLVFALSVGAYATETSVPAPSSSSNTGENDTVTPAEKEPSGGWLDIPFYLVEDMLDDGSVVFSTERYLTAAEYQEGEAVYELDSWLLDQIGTKLDTTDGDVKNAKFTLATVEGSSEKLKVRLSSDGALSFPCQDKNLVFEIREYGTITIPAVAADYGITEILISVANVTVNFEAYSDGTLITGLDAGFEPAEGTTYTLTQPEPEAETTEE